LLLRRRVLLLLLRGNQRPRVRSVSGCWAWAWNGVLGMMAERGRVEGGVCVL
jgi:hypothetical protein